MTADADRPVVYVAGPITLGPLDRNVFAACMAGVRLIRAGLAPIVPQLTCYLGQTPTGDGEGVVPEVAAAGIDHATWLAVDLPLVRRCDALLRLPGASKGADLEVAEAGRAGIPVFTDETALVAWAATRRQAAEVRHLRQLCGEALRQLSGKIDPDTGLPEAGLLARLSRAAKGVV